MALTRVVVYPETGGRELRMTDLNVVIRNSFNLVNGEVTNVLSLPLDTFKGLKFIIEGFNSLENKYILKEYSVLAFGTTVKDSCSNILRSGQINFLANFFIDAGELKVEIGNDNDFELSLEVVRIVVGGS